MDTKIRLMLRIINLLSGVVSLMVIIIVIQICIYFK